MYEFNEIKQGSSLFWECASRLILQQMTEREDLDYDLLIDLIKVASHRP
jgi:hypothetical protein